VKECSAEKVSSDAGLAWPGLPIEWENLPTRFLA
jgi:hypothetical protein